MKAMILAAGYGKRLKPYTDLLPKPLIKVGIYSLIEYHLFALAKANVHEVVINLHYLPELIERALGDGSKYGVKIYYSYEPVLLGTAGGIINALQILGKEPFLLISADIYTDFPLLRLISDFKALKNQSVERLAHLVMVNNPSFHLNGDFGLSENGYLVDNVPNLNSYTFANVSIINPQLFTGMNVHVCELGPILKKHAKQHLITAEVYNGVWENIGSEEILLALRKRLESV